MYQILALSNVMFIELTLAKLRNNASMPNSGPWVLPQLITLLPWLQEDNL